MSRLPVTKKALYCEDPTYSDAKVNILDQKVRLFWEKQYKASVIEDLDTSYCLSEKTKWVLDISTNTLKLKLHGSHYFEQFRQLIKFFHGLAHYYNKLGKINGFVPLSDWLLYFFSESNGPSQDFSHSSEITFLYRVCRINFGIDNDTELRKFLRELKNKLEFIGFNLYRMLNEHSHEEKKSSSSSALAQNPKVKRAGELLILLYDKLRPCKGGIEEGLEHIFKQCSPSFSSSTLQYKIYNLKEKLAKEAADQCYVHWYHEVEEKEKDSVQGLDVHIEKRVKYQYALNGWLSGPKVTIHRDLDFYNYINQDKYLFSFLSQPSNESGEIDGRWKLFAIEQASVETPVQKILQVEFPELTCSVPNCIESNPLKIKESKDTLIDYCIMTHNLSVSSKNSYLLVYLNNDSDRKKTTVSYSNPFFWPWRLFKQNSKGELSEMSIEDIPDLYTHLNTFTRRLKIWLENPFELSKIKSLISAYELFGNEDKEKLWYVKTIDERIKDKRNNVFDYFNKKFTNDVICNMIIDDQVKEILNVIRLFLNADLNATYYVNEKGEVQTFYQEYIRRMQAYLEKGWFELTELFINDENYVPQKINPKLLDPEFEIELFIRCMSERIAYQNMGWLPDMEAELKKYEIEKLSSEEDKEGNTALIKTVKEGAIFTLKILLDYGIDPTFMTKKGETALMCAVANEAEIKESKNYERHDLLNAREQKIIIKLLLNHYKSHNIKIDWHQVHPQSKSNLLTLASKSSCSDSIFLELFDQAVQDLGDDLQKLDFSQALLNSFQEGNLIKMLTILIQVKVELNCFKVWKDTLDIYKDSKEPLEQIQYRKYSIFENFINFIIYSMDFEYRKAIASLLSSGGQSNFSSLYNFENFLRIISKQFPEYSIDFFNFLTRVTYDLERLVLLHQYVSFDLNKKKLLKTSSGHKKEEFPFFFAIEEKNYPVIEKFIDKQIFSIVIISERKGVGVTPLTIIAKGEHEFTWFEKFFKHIQLNIETKQDNPVYQKKLTWLINLQDEAGYRCLDYLLMSKEKTPKKINKISEIELLLSEVPDLDFQPFENQHKHLPDYLRDLTGLLDTIKKQGKKKFSAAQSGNIIYYFNRIASHANSQDNHFFFYKKIFKIITTQCNQDNFQNFQQILLAKGCGTSCILALSRSNLRFDFNIPYKIVAKNRAKSVSQQSKFKYLPMASETLLHAAISEKNHFVINELLQSTQERKVNINVVDRQGNTPILHILESNYLHTDKEKYIKLLIKEKCKIFNIYNNKKFSVFHYAAIDSCSSDIFILLLDHLQKEVEELKTSKSNVIEFLSAEPSILNTLIESFKSFGHVRKLIPLLQLLPAMSTLTSLVDDLNDLTDSDHLLINLLYAIHEDRWIHAMAYFELYTYVKLDNFQAVQPPYLKDLSLLEEDFFCSTIKTQVGLEKFNIFVSMLQSDPEDSENSKRLLFLSEELLSYHSNQSTKIRCLDSKKETNSRLTDNFISCLEDKSFHPHQKKNIERTIKIWWHFLTQSNQEKIKDYIEYLEQETDFFAWLFSKEISEVARNNILEIILPLAPKLCLRPLYFKYQALTTQEFTHSSMVLGKLEPSRSLWEIFIQNSPSASAKSFGQFYDYLVTYITEKYPTNREFILTDIINAKDRDGYSFIEFLYKNTHISMVEILLCKKFPIELPKKRYLPSSYLSDLFNLLDKINTLSEWIKDRNLDISSFNQYFLFCKIFSYINTENQDELHNRYETLIEIIVNQCPNQNYLIFFRIIIAQGCDSIFWQALRKKLPYLFTKAKIVPGSLLLKLAKIPTTLEESHPAENSTDEKKSEPVLEKENKSEKASIDDLSKQNALLTQLILTQPKLAAEVFNDEGKQKEYSSDYFEFFNEIKNRNYYNLIIFFRKFISIHQGTFLPKYFLQYPNFRKEFLLAVILKKNILILDNRLPINNLLNTDELCELLTKIFSYRGLLPLYLKETILKLFHHKIDFASILKQLDKGSNILFFVMILNQCKNSLEPKDFSQLLGEVQRILAYIPSHNCKLEEKIHLSILYLVIKQDNKNTDEFGYYKNEVLDFLMLIFENAYKNPDFELPICFDIYDTINSLCPDVFKNFITTEIENLSACILKLSEDKHEFIKYLLDKTISFGQNIKKELIKKFASIIIQTPPALEKFKKLVEYKPELIKFNNSDYPELLRVLFTKSYPEANEDFLRIILEKCPKCNLEYCSDSALKIATSPRFSRSIFSQLLQKGIYSDQHIVSTLKLLIFLKEWEKVKILLDCRKEISLVRLESEEVKSLIDNVEFRYLAHYKIFETSLLGHEKKQKQVEMLDYALGIHDQDSKEIKLPDVPNIEYEFLVKVMKQSFFDFERFDSLIRQKCIYLDYMKLLTCLLGSLVTFKNFSQHIEKLILFLLSKILKDPDSSKKEYLYNQLLASDLKKYSREFYLSLANLLKLKTPNSKILGTEEQKDDKLSTKRSEIKKIDKNLKVKDFRAKLNYMNITIQTNLANQPDSPKIQIFFEITKSLAITLLEMTRSKNIKKKQNLFSPTFFFMLKSNQQKNLQEIHAYLTALTFDQPSQLKFPSSVINDRTQKEIGDFCNIMTDYFRNRSNPFCY